MKIVNLTPHVLRLYNTDGAIIEEIAPEATPARVTTTPGGLRDIGLSVPVAAPTVWGTIEGLPRPQDGVVYVVSLFVAQRAQRADVLSPGTGPNDGCVRDAEGRIDGVTRLIAHITAEEADSIAYIKNLAYQSSL